MCRRRLEGFGFLPEREEREISEKYWFREAKEAEDPKTGKGKD